MSGAEDHKRDVVSTGAPLQADEVVDRDEGRRAAADRVEQRHQLRHRGHLHGARRVEAGATADQKPTMMIATAVALRPPSRVVR